MNVRATIGEGNTPLVESRRIGRELGIRRLYFKLELSNPSGSYKDRFTAAQVTALLKRRARACLATTSGNTGASLAAYGARYGIRCVVLTNPGVPAGKLQQMQAYGAGVFRVKDFITSPRVTARVFERLAELSRRCGIPLVVSAYRHCPEGMAGVEPLAAELLKQARGCLDHVFVPIGGGGLFTAMCRGLPAASRCRVHAVQPAGCSTVVAAFERGDNEIRPVESTTRISGLAVPFDIDAGIALIELRRRGSVGIAVSDEEVLAAQRLMLEREGIWAEPAGAAALAGCLRARREGIVSANDLTVCLVTGHGFKDPTSLDEAAARHPVKLIKEGEIGPGLFEESA